MHKNFAMIVLQMVSHTRAEACPPPSMNTTNKLQPFGHPRGKKIDAPNAIRAEVVIPDGVLSPGYSPVRKAIPKSNLLLQNESLIKVPGAITEQPQSRMVANEIETCGLISLLGSHSGHDI